MHYFLNDVPERTQNLGDKGFTMAMDKGLSVRQAEDFLSVCGEYVDIVKLGWATSYVTPNLDEKLKYIEKQVFHSILVVRYSKHSL